LTIYGKEAKSHDEARIQTLKEDMDGVLIFVRPYLTVPITDSVSCITSQAGLFSAALTSFVVDSKQTLKVSPTDQMVYYLEQHSTILSQISQQISSIAPQVSIPSTPPPLFPPFNPLASDLRVNAFWFMALTFSLSAALLAILVQQWVRDYMHIFQRYSDPLKSARIRQYLFEGSEGWYMPIVADAVPGLLHVSLFLFFVGLGDSALKINTTIGLSTEYHRSHRHLWIAVHLHYVCTSHLSAVTIPELVLEPYLVCNPKITRSEIQRSGRKIHVCQHKHGTRTDATFDGGDEGA
jgi:hypothetical protein